MKITRPGAREALVGGAVTAACKDGGDRAFAIAALRKKKRWPKR